MNNRERVLTALDHRQPDRVPYQINFTRQARARMVEFTADPAFDSNLGNCLTSLNCEPDGAWQEVAPGIWEDEFGVRWDRSVDKDIGTVCNQVITPQNLDAYEFPDADDPSRYADYGPALGDKGDRFVIVPFGFSLYERAWTLAGMENLLLAMVANRGFVHALMDRILAFNLGVIENVCSHDVDAMQFGDDWGMQTGLQMGPGLWRKFIKPRIAQMYGLVKSRGKAVFIHSCGKVDGIFPDLIECGVDVFNPFQPEVMDVEEIKGQYGEHLAFYGGISTQQTLPFGTPAQVAREVRWLLQVVGENGGYIAAPAHDIPADARPENIAAMIEVLQSQ